MGVFSSEAEAKRKQNLRELEDKRLRFAKRLTDEGFSAQACLFAQFNGGFTAVAKCGEDICLIKGPAPGADEDFSIRRIPGARARCEDILIKSEGLGGLLGFGKKGGAGFKLIVDTPDADTVTATICDNGPGISEEDIAQIFEPFFTRKTYGTGLGLSITYGIVQKLGGSISVKSKLGQGASFRVALPRRARPPKESESQ